MIEPSELDATRIFENLVKALPDTLAYEWDDRFGGILAAFPAASEDQILEIVNAQFDQGWNSKTIDGAPGSITAAIMEFGGVAKGQQLFTCRLTENIVLLGLWWPWGNSATISIRFVPHSYSDSDPEEDTVRTSLKRAFGV